jgi:hypothetical protein
MSLGAFLFWNSVWLDCPAVTARSVAEFESAIAGCVFLDRAFAAQAKQKCAFGLTTIEHALHINGQVRKLWRL